MGAFLCGENNETLSEWLLPPAASAYSPIIFPWNVQRSEPLFSLRRTEPQQRENRDVSEAKQNQIILLCCRVAPAQSSVQKCLL